MEPSSFLSAVTMSMFNFSDVQLKHKGSVKKNESSSSSSRNVKIFPIHTPKIDNMSIVRKKNLKQVFDSIRIPKEINSSAGSRLTNIFESQISTELFRSNIVSTGGAIGLGEKRLNQSSQRKMAIRIASDPKLLTEAIRDFDITADGSRAVSREIQNSVDNYILILSAAGVSPWPATFTTLTTYMAIMVKCQYTTADNKYNMLRKFARIHGQFQEFTPHEEFRWKINIDKAAKDGLFNHSQAAPCTLSHIEKNTGVSTEKRIMCLIAFYFGLRPGEMPFVDESTLTKSADNKFYVLDFTRLPSGALKRPVNNTQTVACVHKHTFADFKPSISMCICRAYQGLIKKKLMGKLVMSDEFKEEVCTWTGDNYFNSKRGYGFRVACVQHLLYLENELGRNQIIRHLKWSNDVMLRYYGRYFRFPDTEYRDVNFFRPSVAN